MGYSNLAQVSVNLSFYKKEIQDLSLLDSTILDQLVHFFFKNVYLLPWKINRDHIKIQTQTLS